MDTLFEALVRHTRGVVDRHGECHIACPECGSESTPHHTKCSFSENGFYCFVCGHKASLIGLAKQVGLDAGVYDAPIRLQEAPRVPATWLSDVERMIGTYVRHNRSWELWQSYKPVSRATYERMRLGVGVLPASKCHHERLIVPVFSGTMCVGLRGRPPKVLRNGKWVDQCDCGKWLAPGGTLIDLYPLYNEQALRPGAVVWVVENPIDALLLTDSTPYVGVATYSVAYWYDAWTATLAAARPEMIVIAYDQDLPGNGGAARRGEFIRDWLKSHPRVPDPAGPKLANRLQAAGLPAILYDWGRAPVKSDIGSLLMGATA